MTGALLVAALLLGSGRQSPGVADTGKVIYASRKDSLRALAVAQLAARDGRLRILVSLSERRLRLMRGADTLLDAPVAIPKGTVFRSGSRRWAFLTPPGLRVVHAKTVDPVWKPPLWHYYEIGEQESLKVVTLRAGHPVRLKDGSLVQVRGARVGIVTDGRYLPVPLDREIVYDSTLFVPPEGTLNRRVAGELGNFSLDIGDGYLIHGSRDEALVGAAVTHGCFRMRNADLEWLFGNTPLRTVVYVF